MNLQAKLDNLRETHSRYVALKDRPPNDPELLSTFDNWYNAAKNLYEAIVQAVDSGKTVILKCEKFSGGQTILRTVGHCFNIDWIRGAPEREATHTFEGVRMSAAETIEVLDE